ncbi:unnamed protein product [Moneuplotes crassus]|uniref:Uncharacterized protein n=1 Tax=Euplotes crassus TaxID=5936 RepID=A0AAD1UAX3_EUPCR|nr:unnamed protein product [Moneuplotes crassus]
MIRKTSVDSDFEIRISRQNSNIKASKRLSINSRKFSQGLFEEKKTKSSLKFKKNGRSIFPNSCKNKRPNSSNPHLLHFNPIYRYSKLLKDNSSYQKQNRMIARRGLEDMEIENRSCTTKNRLRLKMTQAQKNLDSIHKKRDATFSARQKKRDDILTKIDQLRKSQEVHDSIQFKKDFRQVIKRRKKAMLQGNNTTRIDEVKAKKKQQLKDKILEKLQRKEMDRSLFQANQIKADLEDRAFRAKMQQKKKVLERKIRDSRSIEPFDDYSQEHSYSPFKRKRTINITYKQYDAMNRSIQVSKKVKELKKNKVEEMRKKKFENSQKQRHAFEIRQENQKKKREFLRHTMVDLLKKANRVNKSVEVEKRTTSRRRRRGTSKTINITLMNSSSPKMHRVPKKQATIQSKNHIKEKKRKENLIDQILEKNQRHKKICRIKNKYLAKISKQNHKLVEQTASAYSALSSSLGT